MVNLALVALGGMLGAAARYGVGVWLGSGLLVPAHWATLVVNTAGSLLLGWLVGRNAALPGPTPLYLLLVVGFCGSFTTFSSWILDVERLMRAPGPTQWMWHLLLSVALGLAALAAGTLLGERAAAASAARAV